MTIYRELIQCRQTIENSRDALEMARVGRYGSQYEITARWALYNLFEGTFEMAKKIAESKGNKRTKAEFKGFANVELSYDEKAEAKEWIRKVELVQVEIDEMAASLYKISFFRSEATGGYQATAFCADNNSVNAGYILSSFAPHWWDAIAMLAYKHAIKCECVWPLGGSEGGDMWG